MNGTLPETMRDIPATGTRRLDPLEAQKIHHLVAPLKAALRAEHPMTALKMLTVLTAEVMMEVTLQAGDSRAELYRDFSKGIEQTIEAMVATDKRRPM